MPSATKSEPAMSAWVSSYQEWVAGAGVRGVAGVMVTAQARGVPWRRFGRGPPAAPRLQAVRGSLDAAALRVADGSSPNRAL